MKLSQLKKVTYEEIKNKQYEKLRETMGEDIELYFKESGQFIGYQEMEMDSKYLDVHEDISYLKDSVSLHSHIFYEILFCRSGNIQYLIGDMRYQLQQNDIIFVPPGSVTDQSSENNSRSRICELRCGSVQITGKNAVKS